MRISWKHRFADQSLVWSRSKKRDNALGVHSSPNYTMAEPNDLFRKKKKKESLIFIYKDMTLTLKLLSQISDSTKMSLLLAIRHPAIRVRIVAPHTRLRVET